MFIVLSYSKKISFSLLNASKNISSLHRKRFYFMKITSFNNIIRFFITPPSSIMQQIEGYCKMIPYLCGFTGINNCKQLLFDCVFTKENMCCGYKIQRHYLPSWYTNTSFPCCVQYVVCWIILRSICHVLMGTKPAPCLLVVLASLTWRNWKEGLSRSSTEREKNSPSCIQSRQLSTTTLWNWQNAHAKVERRQTKINIRYQ